MAVIIKLMRRNQTTKKLIDDNVEFEYKPTTKSGKSEFFNVPIPIDNLILYWNKKEGLSKLRMPIKDQSGAYLDPSKRLKETILMVKRLIAGTAFAKTEFVRRNRKFSYEEIKLAIDRFALSATSDRHLPFRKDSLRRMGMIDFIYNTYYKEEKYRSMFLFYIENEPQPRVEIAGEVPTDKFPSLTSALLRKFDTVFNFNANDWRVRNYSVVASNRLYDFWVTYEKAQKWAGPLSVNTIANEFVDSLLNWSEWKEDRKVVPQLLDKDWLYKDVFKSYCMRTGLLMMDDYTDKDLPDEALILPLEEEPITVEYKEEIKPSVTSLGNLFENNTEDEEESSRMAKELIKKIRSEKERNRYEIAPYD